MKWFLIILLFFSIIVEAVLTTIPFALIVLLCMAIYYQKPWVFIISLCAGILLDALSFRLLGVSSLFNLTFLCLVFLYQRKFEIQSLPFVVFASGIGSLVFLNIFGFTMIFAQTIVAVCFAVFMFLFIGFMHKEKKSSGFQIV